MITNGRKRRIVADDEGSTQDVNCYADESFEKLE